MVRPRWLRARKWRHHLPLSHTWDKFVAIWASINLILVIFDLSYVPLRNFWLQRQLYLFPGVPLAIPITFLPDITGFYDPIKGIEPHRDTQKYLKQWNGLDQQLLRHGIAAPRSKQLLKHQQQLTDQLITENPFLAADKTGTLERIKNQLRHRTGLESARKGAAQLYHPDWIKAKSWRQERLFWQQEVLPLVQTNYWRSIDETGRATERFWRIDLFWFQSVFALDILLRVWHLKRRFPAITWRDAILRRWMDIPLLLPFWRLTRVIPVAARLRSSGLIDAEPVRVVVSRGVVALLAVELIEVIALQIVEGLQNFIRSPQWEQRIKSLGKPSRIENAENRDLEGLLRLWLPLLLGRVLPNLAPQGRELLAYWLQRSLVKTPLSAPLQKLQPVRLIERGFSRQLAAGMIEALLDLSKGTAAELSRDDQRVKDLWLSANEAFWHELSVALGETATLAQSQSLLSEMLEQLKLTYLSGINSAGVEGLIEKLEQFSGGGLATEP
jgi:hypothetical protein